MAKRSWVVLGAVAVLAVLLGAAWANRDASVARPSGSGVAVGASPDPTATLLATAETTTAPTSTSSRGPARTSVPPPATTPPRASGPAGLAYADFLRRVNADRATVERLDASLTTAVQAPDPAAARRAAVDILDFVDAERDWLREHPPAACYADAHTSAGAMLDAYGAAADSFIAWAQTGGGLAGLSALGDALDAAKTAGDALTSFGHVLEATACPA